ncbi:MAG: hypothetical protein N2Z79_03710 [Candidatus Omnitrophica bacterium]|nr:hypothetical protein [Candidatus Omnitrophota bacterium]
MKFQRVVTFLDRYQIDFLDKLGKDALFSSGTKLSRAKILSWIVDFLRTLDIDGDNIKSEIDFQERIYKKLKDILNQNTSHGCLPAFSGQTEINLKGEHI